MRILLLIKIMIMRKCDSMDSKFNVGDKVKITDDAGKETSILACYFDKVNVKESVLDSLHKKQEQISNQHSDRTEKSQDFREVR